jgi:hypothetical protein
VNLKSISGAAAIALAAVCYTAPASAIPIGDVGQIDQLIAQTNLGNSGNDGEEAWVAGVLGLTLEELVYEEKTNVNGGSWELVTGAGAGVYAFDLFGPTDWFLIKTGNIGGGQTNRHFLFTNLSSFDWAVIRLADLGITQVTNISKISHVGEFTGPDETPVPEPASLTMLGLGLLGLGLARRRRKT